MKLNDHPVCAHYGSFAKSLWRAATPPEQIRQQRARPLLESMRDWMKDALSKLSRKSDVTAAIHYATGRWTALTRYCDDGAVEIDNNAAERALRAVALGRKNFLFMGSDSGGQRAAAIYSLLGSAKLNGINPETYLTAVLTRIAEHPINKIEELLPWKLTLSKDSSTSAAA